jgi:uncharacterized coiled-coil DUF342 family protein
MSSEPTDFDPKNFVLVPRQQFEMLLEGSQELTSLVKPLIEERDRLRGTVAELAKAGDDLVENCNKLMKMYKDLKEENAKLTAALARYASPNKKVKGGN